MVADDAQGGRQARLVGRTLRWLLAVYLRRLAERTR